MSKTELKTYWRSLEELSKNEAYVEQMNREFPEGASEFNDGFSRRNFLHIMGASVALAGLAACRKPVQKLLPFKKQPEEVVAGIPLYYASAYPFMDNALGVVITTNEGRPTKIEGNSYHSGSKGATNAHMQAAILDMYDVDRSRNPKYNGEAKAWSDFVAYCKENFSDRSKRIAFISEASSSPTYNRLKRQALQTFPNAKWAVYEPFGPSKTLKAAELTFGSKLRTVHHLDKAKVVVSFDYDFMNTAADNVRQNLDYANARRVKDTKSEMNRLYVIENGMTVTGSNADHRLRIKASEIPLFIAALASKLSASVSGLSEFSGINNAFSQHAWVSVIAEELLNNRGTSLLTIGADYDVEAQAMVMKLNHTLGNSGQTVTYHNTGFHDASYDPDAFKNVCSEINAGQFDAVVIVGGNPVFNAPSDLNFESVLSKAPVSIHLANSIDETSKKTTWHVNRAHFLEYWGDAESYTGARSVIQPTILPLFGGKSEIEFLAAIVTGESHEGFDLVRETWQNVFPTDFRKNWNTTIHDGVQKGSGYATVNVSLTSTSAASLASYVSGYRASEGVEFVIKPDNKLFDGRFANNGWLQELPDQITKIAWDNVAHMSPATASRFGVEQKKFGVTDYDLVTINAGGTELTVPAWIQPGHADDSITITVGYGRKNVGRIADDIGHDTYIFRTTSNPMVISDVQVSKVRGRTYPIACIQNHNLMEGRPIVREASLEQYRANPTFAPKMVYVPGRREDGRPPNLFNDMPFPEYQPQWAMAIDLNACTGCGVCTIACQAENNIPIVGKREVVRNREMHWIRTDRYYNGDINDPQVVHQPVPCMHCEQAPCELVCPVAATTHSDDGLNQMTYNQCVGTRYCANNCPFKVRRFNFFNYAKIFLEGDSEPEVIQMAMNPDVSIRFRGVMEKCTYCVQRINRGKIDTKNKTGNSIKPADGTVVTACQQACPTQAITFGDITDENSVISRTKANERNYVMLEELNIRPRTSYLAKLRNPNSKLA